MDWLEDTAYFAMVMALALLIYSDPGFWIGLL